MDSLLSVFVLKRRHTLSQAKGKNNTSDITGITHSLDQKYWALQYLYIHSLVN